MATNRHQKAILNRLKILKALHRFGWLRTKDLGVLIWSQWKRGDPNRALDFICPKASGSGLRMAQRTLRSLLSAGFLLTARAPDGANLYCLSQKGADVLQRCGLDARSGKDLIRSNSFNQYRHRCISNEIAIAGMVGGTKVTTEHELAQGRGLIGLGSGKVADVLIRNFDSWHWIEVERSRKNQTEYLKLLNWLEISLREPRSLLAGFSSATVKVVFVCQHTFMRKVCADLKKRGWREADIETLIDFKLSLYDFEVITLGFSS